MFRGIRDRIALYKLNRREKKWEVEFARVVKEAEEKNDQSGLDEWDKKHGSLEYQHVEWLRKRIISDSLVEEADELHLPRPRVNDKDKWDQTRPQRAAGYVLTREAMVELRTAIRNEKRARRETIEWWIKIVGGLIAIVTGLVGALIGLVSVWKHR